MKSIIFRRENLYHKYNCIVILWPDDRNGLPVALLHRSNIKKEQNLRPLKRRSIYSLKLSEKSEFYEEGLLLYNGTYLECTKYLTMWLDKRTKNQRCLKNEKRKRREDDDDENVDVKRRK